MGSEFNLTCVANKLFTGLTGFSTVTWTIPDYDSSLEVVNISTQNNRNVSLLKFNPLRSSHSKDYTCQVSYFSPTGNVSQSIKNASVKAQSKQNRYLNFTSFFHSKVDLIIKVPVP